ncbi:MAG: glycosyltransferase family 2 protein [Candidatus Synoicihabitans palmerolidicus]|nr:glycosyltransferase family 2 protein [Candidatus Synoicihabitans palmerolidicus]
MNTPEVSILIPCYNAAPWLAATLDSALSQIGVDFEVILVNDGSSDDSLALAQSYVARGVKVVSQPNSGAAAARNHGLRLARGEYIQFLDADDLLDATKIQRQLQRLRSVPEGNIASAAWARFHE